MSTRRTINIPIHFEIESDDAASGYSLAQEVWFATGEGVHIHEAARRFVEGIQTIAATENAEVLAAYMFGAACLFLEVAPKPAVSEVKT